jgi:hypothetical protein
MIAYLRPTVIGDIAPQERGYPRLDRKTHAVAEVAERHRAYRNMSDECCLECGPIKLRNDPSGNR